MLKKYIELRDRFSKELEGVSVNVERTCWDFYTNSTDENLEKYEIAQDEYSDVFQNREIFNEFLKIDSEQLPKHEAKQLKDLLKEFDEELNTGEDLKALRMKENEIAHKFNSYIYEIDGKEISKSDIIKIMQTEPNQDIRKKVYETKLRAGDFIAEDLVEFINLRNEYAKKKGYKNYFEYKLKEDYDVDAQFLDKLIEDVYSKAKDKIKLLQEKRKKELKEFFGVEKLKDYHYGLLLDSNPEKAVNKVLENYDIEEISKNIYKSMGYDIEKLVQEGKLTLDLYPRKNKNTHGFCFGIEAGKDSRILANLVNNTISLDTLNHELGHCMYDLGLSTELPFLDRRPASSAVTEAIAMMMGDIMKTENVLSNILPEDLLAKFKNTHSEDEAAFVSRSLEIIEFEREIYKNPNQNAAELWGKIRAKYLNRELSYDNEWATIPHYLSHPAYYQNYFRAALMKAQIYKYLKNEIGFITETKQSSIYMDKQIFKLGASVDEYDLIKTLTKKEFSVDDFVLSL